MRAHTPPAPSPPTPHRPPPPGPRFLATTQTWLAFSWCLESIERLYPHLAYAKFFRGRRHWRQPLNMEIPVHHISLTTPLVRRFRFTRYRKHAPSFGDNGSSYILNTPPHSAIPVHRLSLTRARIRRSPFTIHLNHASSFGDNGIYRKHAPSFGDSGSSYILNTPPLLAIPVHHMS